MSSQAFIHRALAGEVVEPEKEIDDAVDAWHDDPKTELKLSAYLGMTEQEYALWLEKPGFLRPILMARKHKLALDEVLAMTEESTSLAARGMDAAKANELRAWLRQTGRL